MGPTDDQTDTVGFSTLPSCLRAMLGSLVFLAKQSRSPGGGSVRLATFLEDPGTFSPCPIPYPGVKTQGSVRSPLKLDPPA